MSVSKAVAIIPARFESTRFPGKPLAEIADKPMIRHVYERVCRARRVSETIVATDDLRIAETVRVFGGVVRMTSPLHRSGTDRVAEVAANTDAELVMNVQGDEPLIDPACLDALLEPFDHEPQLMISTLSSIGTSEQDLYSPHVVKVVVDVHGYALYFSRSPIPYGRFINQTQKRPRFYKHIGLYAYRRAFLQQLPFLSESLLEQTEGLEQLRFLENGFRIKVVNTSYESFAVDTPEDLTKVTAFIKERAWQPSSSS